MLFTVHSTLYKGASESICGYFDFERIYIYTYVKLFKNDKIYQ